MHAAIPSFKLVLIGESGVGKTSVFMRVKDGMFSSDATIGVEVCNTEMFVDDIRVKLCLWDTAGVERFRTLTRNYYRHCHCVLLACSLDDKTSLDNLHRWNQDVDFYCKECVKVVLANKSDLANEISADQLQNFASTFNCKLIANVSAKTGEGMYEMLTEVSRLLIGAHNLRARVIANGGGSNGKHQNQHQNQSQKQHQNQQHKSHEYQNQQHQRTQSFQLRRQSPDSSEESSRKCCISS